MSESDDLYDYFRDTKRFYKDNPKYINVLQQLDYYSSLFNNLNTFTSGQYIMATQFNDYEPDLDSKEQPLEKILEYLKMVTATQLIDLSELMSSLSASLYSIRLCIEVVSVSDALTLFRKFKDDFFLFMFLVKIGSPSIDQADSKNGYAKWNSQVKHAYDWVRDCVKKRYYQDVIVFLKEDKCISELDNQISLFESIKTLTNSLNDFAHSNGIDFLNTGASFKHVKQTERFFDFLSTELNILCGYMFTLLFYLSPKYMASDDYVGSLDIGIKPPENSQYWIAPYIQKYIDEKLVAINPLLKKFLVDNSGMVIE